MSGVLYVCGEELRDNLHLGLLCTPNQGAKKKKYAHTHTELTAADGYHTKLPINPGKISDRKVPHVKQNKANGNNFGFHEEETEKRSIVGKLYGVLFLPVMAGTSKRDWQALRLG